MAPYNRLRIKSLKFISLVDRGAQGEISNVVLAKRARSGAEDFTLVAKVATTVPRLGIVFGYALASTVDGGRTPHVDMQNDAVVGGDELIKIAADFAEAGAYSDVMHEGESTGSDGRVIFMLPLTADVKAALKVRGDVEGLAIGMKPSTEAFKRYESGELNAFSIAGTGERELVKNAPVRQFRKRTVLTSIVEGHQHSIDLDEPASYYRDRLSTSYQVAEGATEGHCHAWVYDAATGVVTIALDSGHDHAVAEPVPAEVLAAALVEEAEPPTCEPACDPAVDGPTISVVVARAPAGVSTRPGADPTVVPKEMPTVPTAEETRIAELTKQVARLEQLNTLTDSQRAHYAQLRGGDAEAFLAKSHLDRETVLKALADADAPVYKTASGIEIRKSDGPVALELAKQADLAAKAQAVTTELLAKAQAATETAAIEKRATADLAHFAKALPVHVAIVRAIDGIPDEAIRKEAHEAIKAADAAMLSLTKAHGVNPGTAPAPDSPKAAFDAGLVGFAKARFKVDAPTTKQLAAATADFLKTAEGSDLYAEAYPRVQA